MILCTYSSKFNKKKLRYSLGQKVLRSILRVVFKVGELIAVQIAQIDKIFKWFQKRLKTFYYKLNVN